MPAKPYIPTAPPLIMTNLVGGGESEPPQSVFEQVIEQAVEEVKEREVREPEATQKEEGKLPQKLLYIPNADKGFHESWYDGRDMLNFPHPFRAVLLGPPNMGKSTVAKNILLRADPPFKAVKVIHCDPEYTQEYDDLKIVEMLGEIPAPDEFEGEQKTLVILDDLEVKQLPKDQNRNLDRLFGFVSTHKNISVVLCSQDPFNVPAIVRRCANLWVLWTGSDMDAMANVIEEDWA